MRRLRAGFFGVLVLAGLLAVAPAGVGAAAPAGNGGDPVAAHWTVARQRAAIPRDLVIDERGLAYRQGARGSLVPHGHRAGQLYAEPTAKAKPTPTAKPSSGDKAGPSVTNTSPAGGDIVTTTSVAFSATVTDSPSGVSSVSIAVRRVGSTAQSFSAPHLGSNVYGTTLNGFTDGSWEWRVVAKDRAKPANTTTTSYTPFTVNTGGGGGGGGGTTTVTNAPWTGNGTVQRAAGRIFFQMPSNAAQTSWTDYVCSGTVADDSATTGRSVIITAAHCVYDDEHKVFARSVIFIPDQDHTSGTGSDRNCSNDPIGCWSTSFGVVEQGWADKTFPANIPWDYAYYVVNDVGAHSGTTASSDALDAAAGDLPVQFTSPGSTAFTYALGYSYSDDPNFMYCAQALGTEASYGDWWLSQCDLSGGSSGGPWMQSAGEGPIMSVNSWGYTNNPGMGGPKLSGTTASCLFGRAKTQSFTTVTGRGVVVASTSC